MCPALPLASAGPRPHLLHERLDLVLQVLGQLWAPPAWGGGQEAEAVDGTKLPLHPPAHLEQSGRRERRASRWKGP